MFVLDNVMYMVTVNNSNKTLHVLISEVHTHKKYIY